MICILKRLTVRMSSSYSAGDIGDLPCNPCQPGHIAFPPHQFGKKLSKFSAAFRQPGFNVGDGFITILQDGARCFSCCKAVREGRVKVTGNADKSFLTTGFTNWKDATAKFTKHETSYFHKMCVEALSPADVGDMLNREAATERKQNRTYLLKILSSVRFLARQGLPLRGDGDETNSNFHQLLLLQSVEDCPGMSKFLERKQLKYTSHEVQNEFLSIMAQQVLRQVAASLQSSVY